MTDSFATPMDCSLPDSSVHRICQARILEWVAISYSKGSSRPRDRTHVSCIAGGSLPLSHLDGPASRKPGGNSFTLSTNIQSSFHERKERNREKDIFLFIWNGNHIKGNGNPLQYLCLENSIDRGAWKATVHGVTKSWTRLSFHIFTS